MSNLVVNGSFDSPDITAPPGYGGYYPTTWTRSSNNVGVVDFALSGDTTNGLTINPLPPQHCYLLNTSTISQTITFPSAGKYVFTFWTALHYYGSSLVVNLQGNIGTSGSVASITSSYTAFDIWAPYSILFSVNSPQSQLLELKTISAVTSQVWVTGISVVAYIPPPCFREGTLISCLKNGAETEVPIERLKEFPYLVKTLKHGYLPIHSIGKSLLQNPGNRERIKTRLYKLTQLNYPEIYTPLYLTGCHGILVPSLSDREKQACQDQYEGKVFVTDGHYRLFTCLDERAEPFAEEGEFPIYHVALQSKDELVNYGIYANGLLVESCSIWSLTEKHKQVELLYPGE